MSNSSESFQNSLSPQSPHSSSSHPTPHTPHPTPHTPHRVFVYGSLKPGEMYYSTYCEGRVVAYEEAIALGQLYALPLGYPAMAEGNDPVHGYLFSFDDPAVLNALDELEDYDPDRPHGQNEYNRIWVEVFTPTMEPLGFAWAYRMAIAQIESFRGVLLPEGRWTGKENYF